MLWDVRLLDEPSRPHGVIAARLLVQSRYRRLFPQASIRCRTSHTRPPRSHLTFVRSPRSFRLTSSSMTRFTCRTCALEARNDRHPLCTRRNRFIVEEYPANDQPPPPPPQPAGDRAVRVRAAIMAYDYRLSVSLAFAAILALSTCVCPVLISLCVRPFVSPSLVCSTP